MTNRPDRIIDAHMHLWDPEQTDWYPYLGGGRDLGLGDVSGMARRFDTHAYRAESAGWNVVRVVNVAAATGRHSVDETIELDRSTPDLLGAIIGGLPRTDTTADAIALVDRQMAAPRFRGVRPMSPTGPAVPPDVVLRALAERGLVFELLTRPAGLADAAARLAGHPELTVVVEHAGWPASGERDERSVWLAGLRALADAGPHISCKLSGVAAAAGGLTAAAVRPWIEPAIEVFGVERCLFASNFPVDGLHGTLDELWGAYSEVTDGLSADGRDRLFAANAQRIYRC